LKQQNNNIEELFKDKLHNLEADPGANAWANVQASISPGAASGTAATSAGSWTSTVIVGAMITAVAIGGFYFFKNEGEKKSITKQQDIEVINETSDNAPINSEETTVLETATNSTKITDAQKIESNRKNSAETAIDESIRKTADPTDKVKVKKDATVESSDPVIAEKSIDEILAEHQKFLNEQAATSVSSKTEQPEESNKTQVKIPSPVINDPNVSASSENNNSDTGFKEEQQKIAQQVIFPSIFTPNMDGSNDKFKMTVEKSMTIDNIQVSILDRSGKVIGAFTGIYNGWNGNLLNGSAAPAGQYAFQAIIFIGDNQYRKLGGFTLTR
jgi:gliding motility-associated-like protein